MNATRVRAGLGLNDITGTTTLCAQLSWMAGFAETDETNNGIWAIIEPGTQADGLRTVELIESDEPPPTGSTP